MPAVVAEVGAVRFILALPEILTTPGLLAALPFGQARSKTSVTPPLACKTALFIMKLAPQAKMYTPGFKVNDFVSLLAVILTSLQNTQMPPVLALRELPGAGLSCGLVRVELSSQVFE